MPLFSFASALCTTGIFKNSASRHCPAGAFLLALLLLVPQEAFARPSSDPADVVDQQRAFLDQTMQNIEHQRLEQEAYRQAEEKLKKRRTERRLAVQLRGLSGTLSGLPELPNFNGKFQTQPSDQRLPTKD